MNIKHPQTSYNEPPASSRSLSHPTLHLLLETGAAFAHLRQGLNGRGPRLGVRVAGQTADLSGGSGMPGDGGWDFSVMQSMVLYLDGPWDVADSWLVTGDLLPSISQL